MISIITQIWVAYPTHLDNPIMMSTIELPVGIFYPVWQSFQLCKGLE